MPCRTYTNEQIKKAIMTSRSYAQVLKKLGLKPAGGNYKTIKHLTQTLKISTAHFYGRGWNRGADYVAPKKQKSLAELLVVSDKPPQTYKLKVRLFREGVKKNICELCGITDWCGKPIAMHLDHINGDNRDNRIQNLRIVCPNCHAQTPTYCANNWGKYAKGT